MLDTLQKELWYVLVLDESDRLVVMDPIKTPKRVVSPPPSYFHHVISLVILLSCCLVVWLQMKSEVKFQAPRMRKGAPYKYSIHVLSANYVDLEFESSFQYVLFVDNMLLAFM